MVERGVLLEFRHEDFEGRLQLLEARADVAGDDESIVSLSSDRVGHNERSIHTYRKFVRNKTTIANVFFKYERN